MVVGMAVVIASAYVRYRFSRTTLTPAIEVRGDLIYERNYWRRHFREALRQLAVLFTVIGGIVFLIGLYRHF